MKKLFLIAFVFTISFFMQSVPVLAQNAGQYMDMMSKEFDDMTADLWDYTSAVAHGKSARKVENRRKDLLKTIQDAQKRIGKMSAFEGDKALRDSVLSFLKLDYNVINFDYAKIMDMEEIAEQSYDKMEAYMTAQELAGQKLDAAGEMVDEQVKVFAGLHKVNLIAGTKDKTSKKLEEAGKAFKYYNKIYLVFFKSYKQEAYMIDALNKGDVNGLKQNLNALEKCSGEGLQKMDTVKAYRNDNSLKIACNEMLTFYKSESTKSQAMVNFLVQKENFEKIKKAFEAKSESSRSKSDIDDYNKAVNEFNQASNEYNKVNNEMNTKRTGYLDKWNNSVSNFMSAQVPKKK